MDRLNNFMKIFFDCDDLQAKYLIEDLKKIGVENFKEKYDVPIDTFFRLLKVVEK